MAMDEKGLGQRLQAARQQAGLTQQMLCQQADLSYSTLTKIERGAIKSPSIFTIQRIAEALGVSLDVLLGVAPLTISPARNSLQKKYTSKSGVSFVYFDINGCLVRFFHAAFTRLSVVSGEPADVVETLFWHYNDRVCRGDMTVEEFNEAISKALHVPTIDWLDYYLDAVEPVPVMSELLEWVAAHYHVGLLTNIMPGFIDALRKKGLIPDIDYDVIIDSSVEHKIKPESVIFKEATKRAKVPGAQILFVDDSRTNLMAAEKEGWHVLWFDDYNPEEAADRIRQALELPDSAEPH